MEVDLFELMCKVLDQNLFAQVDWARNSYYFKELKVGTKSALRPPHRRNAATPALITVSIFPSNRVDTKYLSKKL